MMINWGVPSDNFTHKKFWKFGMELGSHGPFFEISWMIPSLYNLLVALIKAITEYLHLITVYKKGK